LRSARISPTDPLARLDRADQIALDGRIAAFEVVTGLVR
jgi:hypothetical protein